MIISSDMSSIKRIEFVVDWGGLSTDPGIYCRLLFGDSIKASIWGDGCVI